jgi:hypothetical protein
VNASTLPGAAPGRRRRVVVLIIYFGLLCADVALTNWDDLFGGERCDQVSLTTRMWYQRLVTLGYRKPRPHLTRLVIVASPPGHDFSPCERRAYLARLINRLSDFNPGIIVLDYSFRPRNDCTKGETLELQAAIDSLGEKTPIIVGRYTWTEQELRDNNLTALLDHLKAHGFSEYDQVIASTDVNPHSKVVSLGLLRLDCDTRKIPLLWRGRLYSESDLALVNPSTVPTISLLAARAYDDAIDLQLTSAFAKHQNPFTSFVRQPAFSPVKASEILADPIPSNKFNLSSKIVVVGEETGDIHESVLGRVPGAVLQANYIESLLDDRYFFSLGSVGVPLTTFFCLLIIALIFAQSKSLKAALSVAVIFWFSLLFVTYVGFVHFALLFTSWVPSLLAIIAGAVAKLRES